MVIARHVVADRTGGSATKESLPPTPSDYAYDNMSDTQHNMTTTRNDAMDILDVEDEDQRQQRMHGILMQLDSQLHARRQQKLAAKMSYDFGDRKTFMVPPPSELLSRVEAFLPQFAASTADITRRAQADPDSVDIEKFGHPGPYIQMKLGLGVYEEKRGTPSSSAGESDAEMDHHVSSATSSSSDSAFTSQGDDSSDEYDSDSSVDIISSAMSSLQAARPIRPLPRRKTTRPQIVVVGDSSATSPSSSGDSQR